MGRFFRVLWLCGLLSVSSSPLSCCRHVNQGGGSEMITGQPNAHDSLISCVNSTTRYSANTSSSIVFDSRIAFATFASSDIYSFASFSSLLVSLYAQSKSYEFRLLNADTGDDHSNDDMRWNKVKSALMALNPRHGWARNFDALVYVDADLLVLDFSLDIEIYLSMYSNHDLIMSADALDVGNTGFLIIRNTDWTRRFFATWWLQRGSKFTFCDQHVLNKLYHEKIEWRQRIKILPSHELNSIWPAMENLRSDHRILHLMGELNVYRDAVFENISRTTCAALASEYIPRLENKINWGLLPHQLGVTREKLVDLARNSILQERSRALQICRNNLERSKTGVGSIATYEALHDATANYCDDRRPYLGANRTLCKLMFVEVYNIHLNALSILDKDVRTYKSSLFSTTPISISDQNERVFFLNEVCKIQFELLYFIAYNELPRLMENFIDSLQDLVDFVDMSIQSNIQYVQHKKGVFYASLARLAQQNDDWGSAINYGLNSVDELGALLPKVSENDLEFSVFILDYIDAVWMLSKAFQMVGEMPEALEWASVALKNAKQFYSSYNGEERLMIMQLTKLYVAVARLQSENYYDQNNHDAAINTLVDMNETLSKFMPTEGRWSWIHPDVAFGKE